MAKVERIFPECDSDTLLVELILQRGKPFHQKGISKTVKCLVDYPGNDLVIGLADTDKFKRDKDNPNINKFTETVEDRLDKEGIIILKIPDKNKYLIRIHPEFERWIWKIANDYGIDTAQYGVSSLGKLYELSKHYRTNEDPQFKKFVNAVVLNDPQPAPIATLKRWFIKVFE
jgi:hypothetical protein